MTSHNHHHIDSSSGRISVAFFLNFFFTIIEFIGGYLTNSTAIMADAVHDLGDTLSIGLAWLLSKVSSKHPDDAFTYGYRRFSLLGALVNGVVLIAGSIWILSEAIPRLTEPEMPHAQGMLWLAILGICVNGYAAWKVSKGKVLNERILSWHLLEDVLGWLAVLLVSIVLMFFDWPIIDPMLSIGFTLYILVNVLRNTKITISLFLQSVPDKKILEKIQNYLNSIDHVRSIHHVHLWSMDGENHVLTAHLELDQLITPQEQQVLKNEILVRLSELSLSHTTIEFEFPDEQCRDVHNAQ